MSISDIYRQVYGDQYGYSDVEYDRRYQAGEERINRATAEANKALRTNLATSGFAGGRALAYGGAQIGAGRLRELSDLENQLRNESEAIARGQKARQFEALTREGLAVQQHGFQLEYLSEEQKNVLERMDQQQKYDLIKMAQQFEYDQDLLKLQKELNKRGWGSLLGTIVGGIAGSFAGGAGAAAGANLGSRLFGGGGNA